MVSSLLIGSTLTNTSNASTSEKNGSIFVSIDANQCIVIEDSRWGLKAAKAAGMHAIAVTNSYDADELSLAEKIVTRLNELSMNDLQQLCA